MITNLRFQHFKSWRDTGDLSFGRITAFFGANSSGKSSIIQFLLTLKQTAATAGYNSVFSLGSASHDSLGGATYGDVVFNHDVGRQINFEISWSKSRKLSRPRKEKVTAADRSFFATIGLIDRRVQVVKSIYSRGSDARMLWDDKSGTMEIRIASKASSLKVTNPRGLFGHSTALRSAISAPSFGHESQLFFATANLIPHAAEQARNLVEQLSRTREIIARYDEVSESTTEAGELLRQFLSREKSLVQQELERAFKSFSKSIDGLARQLRRVLRSKSIAENEQVANSYQEAVDSIEAVVQAIKETVLTKSIPLPQIDSSLSALAIGFEQLGTTLNQARQNWETDRKFWTTADMIVNMLEQDLRHELDRISHLGPLRDYPKRLYIATDTPGRLGSQGEMAVPALIAADDQMSEGASVSDTVARVEQWFKRLGLADELRLVPIGDAGQFYTVALRTKQNTAEAQLPDVGFGISQVLPIIVQSYLAPKRAVILLEQPEIHLHPAVQAELADFLIEVSRDRNLQFIIESHSEHFLRRLQQRVAEAQLSEHEVRIYFCERNAEGSMATSLQMDEFGQIPNWPKDFFGPVEEDLEKMVMARIARRKANDAESDRH